MQRGIVQRGADQRSCSHALSVHAHYTVRDGWLITWRELTAVCASAQTGMQGQGMQGMQGQAMQPQGVQVQGMGDGQGSTAGRNTEVGGGVGDFNIDTGNKGRDAGADPS